MNPRATSGSEAIFTVNMDPVIVYTSNPFAIFSLRSLYSAFAGVMDKRHYLKLGPEVVLTFFGLKLLLAHTPCKIDALVSLGVMVIILAISGVFCLREQKAVPALFPEA